MTCPHGYEPPHCPRTGCESSRPAVRLGDWTAEHLAPKPDKAIDPRDYPPEAREVARRMDELGRRDNASGVISPGKVFVGVQENGRKAKGARAWWWQGPLVWVRSNKSTRCCCGNPKPHECRVAQPTHVPGAPEDSSGYAQRTIRDISEAAAQRVILAAELGTTSTANVSRSKVLRHLKARAK